MFMISLENSPMHFFLEISSNRFENEFILYSKNSDCIVCHSQNVYDVDFFFWIKIVKSPVRQNQWQLLSDMQTSKLHSSRYIQCL